ncbi:Sec-independent protein translocase subunit TatA [Nocardiopsis ansamitocini]|uniref:Sec-independent protein translocase protein TatA n=1 Tax=Nocardiopsis ansamitocini TaxID=1670832 RepID=A0A9W6UJL2_9ACTN|nr:Sec-independent protein translocase subunit TatA [Nocardiopsis ansamitocini]GLU48827.1 hypothetical protein Nans01_31780 [Nocardiopsis ansamitocini]
MGIGPREILILLVIALLLFGAKKLPELARAIGRSGRILKAEAKGLSDEENEAGQAQQPQQAQAPEQPQPQPATPQAYDAQHNQSYQQPQQTPQGYPQLPPGQRIVDGSTETSQQRQYGS